MTHLWPACLLMTCALAVAGCPAAPDADPITVSAASVTCSDTAGPIAWRADLRVDGPATDDGAELEIRSATVPNPEPYDLALLGRNGDASVEYLGEFAGNTTDPGDSEVPFDCAAVDLEIILCVVNREDGADSCWACGDGSGTLPGRARAWTVCD